MVDGVLDFGAAHAWKMLAIVMIAACIAGIRRYGRRLERRTEESSQHGSYWR